MEDRECENDKALLNGNTNTQEKTKDENIRKKAKV